MKNVLVFLLGLSSLIYLLNPGAGLFELIPDNLPLIGNLDEVAAGILMLIALKHFDIDWSDFFSRNDGSGFKDINFN